MVCAELPKIYFPSSPPAAADLQPGSDDWVRIRAEVWRAMESHGCFEAVFPELLPEDLRAAMFSAEKKLFDLPAETKMNIINDESGQERLSTPHLEMLSIKDAIDLANIQSFAHVLWPSNGNPTFSETAHSTVKHVSKLDHMVRKMIMESLGVVKYYDEDINSTYYLLRMIKYEKPSREEGEEVLPHHSDASLLTILFQNNNVSSLEVQDSNGDWLPALTIPNCFVVLAGDSLTAWSNGRVSAPQHRVVMKGDEERYSVGMFALYRAGYMVRAPQELIDDEHPSLFKPFDAVEYLAFRFNPESYSYESPLKAFCGN